MGRFGAEGTIGRLGGLEQPRCWSPTVEMVGKGYAIEWEWERVHIGTWIDVKLDDCRPMNMSMN